MHVLEWSVRFLWVCAVVVIQFFLQFRFGIDSPKSDKLAARRADRLENMRFIADKHSNTIPQACLALPWSLSSARSRRAAS